jgi:hypothetical protein
MINEGPSSISIDAISDGSIPSYRSPKHLKIRGSIFRDKPSDFWFVETPDLPQGKLFKRPWPEQAAQYKIIGHLPEKDKPQVEDAIRRLNIQA